MTAQVAYDIGLLTHLVDLSEVESTTNVCRSGETNQ